MRLSNRFAPLKQSSGKSPFRFLSHKGFLSSDLSDPSGPFPSPGARKLPTDFCHF